jgi:hypothetical protein
MFIFRRQNGQIKHKGSKYIFGIVEGLTCVVEPYFTCSVCETWVPRFKPRTQTEGDGEKGHRKQQETKR